MLAVVVGCSSNKGGRQPLEMIGARFLMALDGTIRRFCWCESIQFGQRSGIHGHAYGCTFGGDGFPRGGTENETICSDQAVRVYLKWAEENPKNLHYTARETAIKAFHEAWPYRP